MSERAFQSERMGVPTWTAQDNVLWRLAREYHERTEWFDQAYCWARDKDGFAIPTGEERSVCSRFARDVRRELDECAQAMGVHGLSDAIQSDARHFERDRRDGKRHLVTPDPKDPSPLPRKPSPPTWHGACD